MSRSRDPVAPRRALDSGGQERDLRTGKEGTDALGGVARSGIEGWQFPGRPPAHRLLNRCRVPEYCLVRWERQRRDGLCHLGHVAGGADAGKPCTSDSVAPGWFCLIDEGRGADLVLGQPDFT